MAFHLLPSAPFSYLENLLNLLSVSFTICKMRKLTPIPAAPEDCHKAEIMHVTSLGQKLHPSLSAFDMLPDTFVE